MNGERTSPRRRLVPALMAPALLIAAWTPSTSPSASRSATSPPSASPTASSAPSPIVDPRCPKPAEGTQLLTHEADGYCFLYPDRLLRVDPSPHTVCLRPPRGTPGR